MIQDYLVNVQLFILLEQAPYKLWDFGADEVLLFEQEILVLEFLKGERLKDSVELVLKEILNRVLFCVYGIIVP